MVNMDDTMTTKIDSSGRFVLRIDPGLHASLREAAREADMSLNEYCALKLALPSGSSADWAVEAVRRAAFIFGSALVGVVAFGSWSRGEAATSSDIDLMIVVDESVEINRRLYRDWDDEPIYWNTHLVEPHFAHLPASATGGIWAEIAVDGVILFERGLLLSKRLVNLRQDIADGRLVRRRVHGQPYWVDREEGA